MTELLLRQLAYNPEEPIIFSTSLFLLLFAGFTLVYAMLSRRDTMRIAFVTLFSYYFYYKSSGFYFVLLAVVTVSDYYLARAIHRSLQEHPGQTALRRRLLTLSLAVDLGMLGYFKYANFFAQTLADIAGRGFQPWDIFLPVGISFFTFQSMSYTIDIFRGHMKPVGSLLDYAFYVSFFPQLVAGPIVRARDFAPQIRRAPVVTPQMMAQATYFIVAGMVKKCVVSDYISLNFVDRIFEAPELYTGVETLMGVYGYTLQIYCDFSGYSDMAIGIALLLGFHLPKNFDTPYISASVTEFWRRWHMSFSTWIRDYIYISLGGNRRGKLRTYLNLFVTMLIGGLWHGASLNFVAWGCMHGLALVCHKVFHTEIMHRPKDYRSHGLWRLLSILLTFHFVCFTFIFFRNTSFANSMTMLSQMAANFHAELLPGVVAGYKYVFMLIVGGYAAHFISYLWKERAVRLLERGGMVLSWLALVAAIYLVIQVKSSGIQPFIYFQF